MPAVQDPFGARGDRASQTGGTAAWQQQALRPWLGNSSPEWSLEMSNWQLTGYFWMVLDGSCFIHL